MKTYKIYLAKGGTKIITGTLKNYQNHISITDSSQNEYIFKNFNNIEPIFEKQKTNNGHNSLDL